MTRKKNSTALPRVALVLAAVALLAAPASAAVFEEREFASASEEARYRALIEQLRCLVCQNQSLADSGAELAADLRDRVYEMLRAGASDAEIVDFLVARYGDFVLYRPPFDARTAMLWAAPLALGVAGLAVLWRQIARRRALPPAAPLDAAERERLARLLGEGREP